MADVNLATTEIDASSYNTSYEVNPPKVLSTGDAKAKGSPTISNLATGQLANTTLNRVNNQRVHVCDFTAELKKNTELKKYLDSLLQDVRDALRSLGAEMGLDPTGFKIYVDMAKQIVRELKWFNDKVLKPIIQFEKTVLGYINTLNKIIAFIVGLPAKAAKFLAECLGRLLHLAGNIFSDLVTSSVPGGGDFNELISTAKQTLTLATKAAVGATAIVSAAQQTSKALAGNTGKNNPNASQITKAPASLSTPATANTIATITTDAQSVVNSAPKPADVAAQQLATNQPKSTP
jgi:histidyl-tRNA synthetase